MKSEKTVQSMEKELRSLRSRLSAAKKKAAMASAAAQDAEFNRERSDEYWNRLQEVKETNRALQETLREKQTVIDQHVESYCTLSEQTTELRRELAREKRIVDALSKMVGRLFG
jgi:uncharacterized membrane protein